MRSCNPQARCPLPRRRRRRRRRAPRRQVPATTRRGPDDARPRVLLRVRERFRDDEVGAQGDVVGQRRVGDVDLDAERAGRGQRFDGRAQPALAQGDGVQPPREVAQLGVAAGQLVDGHGQDAVDLLGLVELALRDFRRFVTPRGAAARRRGGRGRCGGARRRRPGLTRARDGLQRGGLPPALELARPRGRRRPAAPRSRPRRPPSGAVEDREVPEVGAVRRAQADGEVGVQAHVDGGLVVGEALHEGVGTATTGRSVTSAQGRRPSRRRTAPASGAVVPAGEHPDVHAVGSRRLGHHGELRVERVCEAAHEGAQELLADLAGRALGQRPEQVARAGRRASASSRPVKARTPSTDRSAGWCGGPRIGGAARVEVPHPLRSASSGPSVVGTASAPVPPARLPSAWTAHHDHVRGPPRCSTPRRWPTRRRRRCSGRCAST